MAIKDWNGFKKSGDTYIPNDATARAGVTATVDLMKDTTGWLGKNRMIFDVSSTSTNGVNLTLNGNKTFTVNTESGGATALTVIRVGYITEAGQYILNGCPEGGGDSTYRLDIRPNGSSLPYSGSVDSGSGSNVITVNNNDLPATVNLRIPSGSEISDKLFKPMVRRPNTNPDFEPYHDSVEDWYWSENAKTGVHQLIPYSLASLKANNTGGTWNDNVYTFDNHTFTVNDDLSVTIASTGNTTSSREFYFWKPQSAKELSNVLGRNITISGATGGTPSTYMMTAYRVGAVDGSSGSVYQSTDAEKTFEWKNNCSGTKPLILFGIESGVAVNTTVKPLLRFAEDTCTDFTLPAMTNRELTEKVQEINSSVSLLDSPAEVGSTGMISIPISDIMQYSDIVVVGYNGSDGGGNRFVAVIPTEIDGQFDVGIPFVVKSSTGVGFIVARIASNVLSLTFLDNANTNITTMYVKKIYGRKR